HHLRADQDVGGSRAPVAQDPALRAEALRGVAVEPVDDRQRVAGAQRGLDLLRPHPERLEGARAARRAGGGWPTRVAAVVADERPGRAVPGEGHAAQRAVEGGAAAGALQVDREAAAVQEDERLPAGGEVRLERAAELLGDQARALP